MKIKESITKLAIWNVVQAAEKTSDLLENAADMSLVSDAARNAWSASIIAHALCKHEDSATLCAADTEDTAKETADLSVVIRDNADTYENRKRFDDLVTATLVTAWETFYKFQNDAGIVF